MSDERVALVPIGKQDVTFYGDAITGVLVQRDAAHAEWYVPLRPICTFLGLDWSSQRQRTVDDPVLKDVLIPVVIIPTETAGTPRGRGQGRRTMLCLPLVHLHGWLFGINAGKVKDAALAAKITRYRGECFRKLCEAFAPELLPPTVELAPRGDLAGAALAVEQTRALYELAQQQYAMEQALDALRNKQDVMAGYLRGHLRELKDWQHQVSERLGGLELQLSSGATIAPAQAAEIMLAVKSVGTLLPAQNGRNGHQQVYSEMYRRYGINSYKSLPAAQYDQCIAWLHAWYLELGGKNDVSP